MIKFQNKSNTNNIVCEYFNNDNQKITEFDKKLLYINEPYKSFKSYKYYKYNMNQYKMSTFCFENPIKIPDSLTAYTAKFNEDFSNVTTVKINSNIIPAKTGIILEGEPGVHLIEILNSDYECEPVVENALIGIIEDTLIPIEVEAYILSTNNGEIAWFKLTDNIDQRIISKYKAYMVKK